MESVVFDQKRSCGQQEKEHVQYMSDFSTFAFGATDFAGCPPIILLKAPGQVVAQNGVSQKLRSMKQETLYTNDFGQLFRLGKRHLQDTWELDQCCFRPATANGPANE